MWSFFLSISVGIFTITSLESCSTSTHRVKVTKQVAHMIGQHPKSEQVVT